MRNGKVYLAPSGQWAFKFYEDGLEMGGGAGFATEAKAIEECDVVLSPYNEGPLKKRLSRIETVKFEDLPALG